MRQRMSTPWRLGPSRKRLERTRKHTQPQWLAKPPRHAPDQLNVVLAGQVEPQLEAAPRCACCAGPCGQQLWRLLLQQGLGRRCVPSHELLPQLSPQRQQCRCSRLTSCAAAAAAAATCPCRRACGALLLLLRRLLLHCCLSRLHCAAACSGAALPLRHARCRVKGRKRVRIPVMQQIVAHNLVHLAGRDACAAIWQRQGRHGGHATRAWQRKGRALRRKACRRFHVQHTMSTLNLGQRLWTQRSARPPKRPPTCAAPPPARPAPEPPARSSRTGRAAAQS